MENKKVAFITLGCKVNQYETNAMIQKFKENKYEIVDFDQKADIYIINTCTVTNMADRKSRQMLRKVKEINPKALLVAVGCYAQVAKEELEKIPEIDLILGTNEKNDIVNYVEKMEKENKKQVFEMIADVMHCEKYVDFGNVTFTEKTRAVIKVQDGCDRFCSYCIIPYARGHIRSRNPENVIEEITKIAQEGIKEVVITGIHLTSYGRDFKEQENFNNTNAKEKELEKGEVKDREETLKKVGNKDLKNKNSEFRLIDLLEKINNIEEIERIRLRFIRTNSHYRRFCRKIIKTKKNM